MPLMVMAMPHDAAHARAGAGPGRTNRIVNRIGSVPDIVSDDELATFVVTKTLNKVKVSYFDTNAKIRELLRQA